LLFNKIKFCCFCNKKYFKLFLVENFFLFYLIFKTINYNRNYFYYFFLIFKFNLNKIIIILTLTYFYFINTIQTSPNLTNPIKVINFYLFFAFLIIFLKVFQYFLTNFINLLLNFFLLNEVFKFTIAHINWNFTFKVEDISTILKLCQILFDFFYVIFINL